ncbi:MAG: uncharacterized protein QG559_674, partial [Campylobacterota bacterium]|nr:uncharacterized protein [Campylobacterota bacterium]
RVYVQLLKFKEATKWLEQNAKDGDVGAYYILAQVYCELEDFKNAKKWAQKSIDSGNKEAKLLYEKYELKKY